MGVNDVFSFVSGYIGKRYRWRTGLLVMGMLGRREYRKYMEFWASWDYE